MSCSSGIPNPADCSCIEVPDCSSYTDLWSQYLTLKAWYESLNTVSASIQAALDEIKNLFFSMAEYCTSGPVNGTVVSFNFSIIQELINNLNVNVNEFKSTLKPNTSCPNPSTCDYAYYLDEDTCYCTCSLECDTSYQFFNFQLCTCSNFTCASAMYQLQKQIAAAIQSAISQINSDAAAEYLQYLAPLQQLLLTTIGYVEFYYNYFPPGDLCAMIADLAGQFQNVTVIYNQKLVNGTCSNTCLPNEIQCIDCTCTTSPEITEFMQTYELFRKNLTVMYSYDGYGNQTQLQVIYDSAANLTMWYNEVYQYISNHCSGLNTTYITQQTGFLASASASINATWTDFINADSPCSAAALDCTGEGNITDSGNCECVYNECMASLPSVLASIANCENEIAALTLDAANKQILLNNW